MDCDRCGGYTCYDDSADNYKFPTWTPLASGNSCLEICPKCIGELLLKVIIKEEELP